MNKKLDTIEVKVPLLFLPPTEPLRHKGQHTLPPLPTVGAIRTSLKTFSSIPPLFQFRFAGRTQLSGGSLVPCEFAREPSFPGGSRLSLPFCSLVFLQPLSIQQVGQIKRNLLCIETLSGVAD